MARLVVYHHRSTTALPPRMPPYSGPPNPHRWTSPLQVDGRPVFTDDGRTLSKYGYEVLLGWVEHGNLTDLGMQAVKDGWWVDPPAEVQAQVRRRQREAYEKFQLEINKLNDLIKEAEDKENKAVDDKLRMPPPPPRPPVRLHFGH